MGTANTADTRAAHSSHDSRFARVTWNSDAGHSCVDASHPSHPGAADTPDHTRAPWTPGYPDVDNTGMGSPNTADSSNTDTSHVAGAVLPT